MRPLPLYLLNYRHETLQLVPLHTQSTRRPNPWNVRNPSARDGMPLRALLTRNLHQIGQTASNLTSRGTGRYRLMTIISSGCADLCRSHKLISIAFRATCYGIATASTAGTTVLIRVAAQRYNSQRRREWDGPRLSRPPLTKGDPYRTRFQAQEPLGSLQAFGECLTGCCEQS